nr:MAG TPA: hypothetical protein [Caudoviricetes sp.]
MKKHFVFDPSVFLWLVLFFETLLMLLLLLQLL